MKSGVTLEQALESLSLERVVIPSVQEKVSDGLDRSGDTLPVGAVVQRGEQRFVVGATFWTGSNAAPESLEFVHRRGDDKHIFILQRTPRVVYIEERVCGCETPGFGSPCPACHETVRVLYGPLAPGVKLESERKVVAYDDVQVRRIYSDGVCRVSPPP